MPITGLLTEQNQSRHSCRDKNKIKIVLEESDESNFWLTFIQDIDLIRPDTELEFLIKESDEFVAILTSALKTLNKS
ncbi:MAG: four helix bundle protein [Candidatus Marinimicrobia bacterium]|nr:four helix bundle protein [Candidatus Neomarinimicrobiota bacterium]